MKNYVQKGDTFKLTAAQAYASGDLVKAGKLVGVAVNDCAIGEECVANMEGVYSVAKKAGVVMAQGDVAYFEADEASDVVGDKIGHVMEAAAGGDATVNVKFER